MVDRRKLPEDWLYQELTALRSEMREQHQRLRSDFSSAIDRLRADMAEHQDFDNETRTRVDRIQTERDVEDKQIVRRSTWLSIVFSAAVMAIWEIIRSRVLGIKP